jgi:ribosomal protein L15E
MSDWKTLHDDGKRLVRISPAGIVVVRDTIPSGGYNMVRIDLRGNVAKSTASSDTTAWRKARAVNRSQAAV